MIAARTASVVGPSGPRAVVKAENCAGGHDHEDGTHHNKSASTVPKPAAAPAKKPLFCATATQLPPFKTDEDATSGGQSFELVTIDDLTKVVGFASIALVAAAAAAAAVAVRSTAQPAPDSLSRRRAAQRRQLLQRLGLGPSATLRPPAPIAVARRPRRSRPLRRPLLLRPTAPAARRPRKGAPPLPTPLCFPAAASAAAAVLVVRHHEVAIRGAGNVIVLLYLFWQQPARRLARRGGRRGYPSPQRTQSATWPRPASRGLRTCPPARGSRAQGARGAGAASLGLVCVKTSLPHGRLPGVTLQLQRYSPQGCGQAV